MTTHAIILGGILKDQTGRPLGPYRLRTALANHGFRAEVVDYAWALREDELLILLQRYISKDTLILGISNIWFTTNTEKNNAELNRWFTAKFFQTVKKEWPWVKIVIGGTKTTLLQGAELLKSPADWWLSGFADIGLPKLLKFLSGQETDLKYRTDTEGTHIVDCDSHYRVENMDELETVLESNDRFYKFQPVSLEVSRGCIFTCSFCAHPFLGKKSFEYIRTPESLATELKRNYDLFRTTRYIITDDTFNDSMEKLERVARAVELSKIPNFEFVSYIRAELLATKPEMIPMLKQLNCKGSFIGLESLNKEARRAIGKGMDAERVIGVLEEFKSATNTKIFASMIVGLPGDSLDDAYSWSERFKREKLFSEWGFQNLGMNFDEFGQGDSIFSRDPAKYGYTVSVNKVKGAQRSYNWTHQLGYTNKDASTVSDDINSQGREVAMAAGFGVAEYWFHGGSDSDIENTPRKEFSVGRRGSESGKIRAKVRVQEARNVLGNLLKPW